MRFADWRCTASLSASGGWAWRMYAVTDQVPLMRYAHPETARAIYRALIELSAPSEQLAALAHAVYA